MSEEFNRLWHFNTCPHITRGLVSGKAIVLKVPYALISILNFCHYYFHYLYYPSFFFNLIRAPLDPPDGNNISSEPF